MHLLQNGKLVKLRKETFLNIATNKHQIQQLETTELKSIVDQYPYFQSARALYLKGLKNQDSFKYNNELKITAAHTTDRTVLFDFITSKEFNRITEAKEEIHQQIINKISDEKPVELISEEKEAEFSKTEQKVEEKLEIGKPISFTNSESYSFNQWLQLSVKKEVVRVEETQKENQKKETIIDKFIQNNPKIKPLPKDKIIAVPIAKNKQDAALMTETLAKVYLEQKKYENAIQAYRILSLKYPEKSGFFADQIKRIQILQKNKS